MNYNLKFIKCKENDRRQDFAKNASMCTTLSEKWASAGKWNGREHGVWEQREMKRMIANIVWTETARPIVCRRRHRRSPSYCLLAQLARTKTALLSKISSRKMAAFQMHGIWPMNSEQKKNMLWGQSLSFALPPPGLNGEKMLWILRLGWVNENVQDHFETIW